MLSLLIIFLLILSLVNLYIKTAWGDSLIRPLSLNTVEERQLIPCGNVGWFEKEVLTSFLIFAFSWKSSCQICLRYWVTRNTNATLIMQNNKVKQPRLESWSVEFRSTETCHQSLAQKVCIFIKLLHIEGQCHKIRMHVCFIESSWKQSIKFAFSSSLPPYFFGAILFSQNWKGHVTQNWILVNVVNFGSRDLLLKKALW